MTDQADKPLKPFLGCFARSLCERCWRQNEGHVSARFLTMWRDGKVWCCKAPPPPPAPPPGIMQTHVVTAGLLTALTGWLLPSLEAPDARCPFAVEHIVEAAVLGNVKGVHDEVKGIR